MFKIFKFPHKKRTKKRTKSPILHMKPKKRKHLSAEQKALLKKYLNKKEKEIKHRHNVLLGMLITLFIILFASGVLFVMGDLPQITITKTKITITNLPAGINGGSDLTIYDQNPDKFNDFKQTQGMSSYLRVIIKNWDDGDGDDSYQLVKKVGQPSETTENADGSETFKYNYDTQEVMILRLVYDHVVSKSLNKVEKPNTKIEAFIKTSIQKNMSAETVMHFTGQPYKITEKATGESGTVEYLTYYSKNKKKRFYITFHNDKETQFEIFENNSAKGNVERSII